jgi:hypothetical protein
MVMPESSPILSKCPWKAWTWTWEDVFIPELASEALAACAEIPEEHWKVSITCRAYEAECELQRN